MKLIKHIFYFLTVIPPIIDAVRGIRDGIRKSGGDIIRTHKENAQRRLWEEVNRSIDDK